MLREDGIRMALSHCAVIRFPSGEEIRDIKRFGEKRPSLRALQPDRGPV